MTEGGQEEPDRPPSFGSRSATAADQPWGAPWIAGAGLAAYLLSLVAARSPLWVERFYVNWAIPFLASPLSRFTGVVPVAVAELILVAYLARRLWTGSRGIRTLRDPGHSSRRALARGGWLLLRDAGLAVLLFYLAWGFHYARPPLVERIGLPEVPSGEASELVERLTEESVTMANRQYRRIHGAEDAGSPTTMPADWAELTPALDRGWDATAAELRLGSETRLAFGRPKAALLSPLLARLGLSGFYFPFTAEAVVNGRTPAVAAATTLAHEQAHQRGITNEGEATFLAHLVAGRSRDPLLRYSAAVRAQSRLLAALRRQNPERADALAERRLPGVRRDLADLAEYHRRYRGPAREVARRVNDTYLRANRVPGGVASYGRVTTLILRYAALRGDFYPSGRSSIRLRGADPVPD